MAGVALFNRGEYFDAHEVWEELWMDCPAADRRFYQSLIQAAVALYHWGNGNRAGAARLFHSGRRYMDPYRPTHRGLDVDRFWRDVGAALGAEPNPPAPFPGREGGVRTDTPPADPASDTVPASFSPPFVPRPAGSSADRAGERTAEGPGEGFFRPRIDLDPSPTAGATHD